MVPETTPGRALPPVQSADHDARFTIDQVRQKLATSFPTAIAAVKVLEDLGIVVKVTRQKKNRSIQLCKVHCVTE